MAAKYVLRLVVIVDRQRVAVHTCGHWPGSHQARRATNNWARQAVWNTVKPTQDLAADPA
eukprot:CAMPEP_0119115350 /NCGR_PEP_ID=MMETSP1180-20130426/50675_1 /TAXON_ID=3052 ORGANISM="Chlamydomonas cf sp, Strain CCMP681" /NCGR_SAMPLE_ID=MMETSP1180 /ASSEMBLY_ACC=CAM_ASM_000741 /LENGTH=59 /DNA_ID=CAMNT_0007104281 /DNA_START=337 /DNA_END=516 /DNA_ORIENTATION=+